VRRAICASHPDFDGIAVFIFQPAEESEGGAAVMIEDGLFERFPVEAVFGLHNWPGIPVGEMAVMPGPVMAGTCALKSPSAATAAMPRCRIRGSIPSSPGRNWSRPCKP
jgi:metal-dependent amidase/aminoacylase/carboxypeptidase family protein